MKTQRFKTIMKIILILVVLTLIIRYPHIREFINCRLIEKEMVGTYHFDIDESNIFLTSEDSMHFSKMKLVLKKDLTFEFSKIIPQVNDSIGYWKVKGWPDSRFTLFTFSNGNERQLSTCCEISNHIGYSYINEIDSTRRNQSRFGRLEFVKQ